MAKRHANRAGNLESLFLRLEELVLANSGEDEFEEVFKLLVAKLYAERTGNDDRFYSTGGEKDVGKTFSAVAELLREADRTWPGILAEDTQPKLTPEHLHVCVEALSRHQVTGEDLDVLDGFFEFLVAKTAKGAKGQYFTPRHVVEMCVRMLAPTKNESVVDPACGSGGFLLHTLQYVKREEGLTPRDVANYCDTKLWGFDISPRAVKVAKALMVLAGDGRANIVRLNSLLRPDMGGLFAAGEEGENGNSLAVEDICRTRIRNHKGFDVVLTNPPFAGEVRERTVLDGYEVGQGRSWIERDVLFVERCVELLRPGGRLAIVLPHNKFAGSAFGHLRQWVVQHARVLAVVGLGRNTFLPHTHQKASVLFVQRRKKGERPAAEERTFFAISERDGKNSKGQVLVRSGAKESDSLWRRVDHDLEEVVKAFREFAADEVLSVNEVG